MNCPKCNSNVEMIPGYKIGTHEYYLWCKACNHEVEDVSRIETTPYGEDEMILRKLLWLFHGCPIGVLYGDDGEMQCHKCKIDFKRFSVEDLETAIRRAYENH